MSNKLYHCGISGVIGKYENWSQLSTRLQKLADDSIKSMRSERKENTQKLRKKKK